jgi:bifunctional pyridoxal-dependent enzyme with beta-cystathionase and maltose regulon repressor activities
VSTTSHDNQAELDVDLDALEAELAEVELMLERLNEPNNPQGGR